ncbi:hypothetical protein [Herbiconiux daphne]|uniref:Uncharacterized protein n=1 Tax=Herbiconiux daphne TaxID=2970914 RepID=A0ABT2HBT4_9MICO|nr:hypothetical protein [Herbiconiux daphne]MCS5737322.1 hypothetical protein [Herbiconiux daphne]
MLNVYISAQKIANGFPERSIVKLIKWRGLGTRAEAFESVQESFQLFANQNPDSVFFNFATEIEELIRRASHAMSEGAAYIASDMLLAVTCKVGEECERISRRGY